MYLRKYWTNLETILTKVCSSCALEKELKEFHYHPGCKQGVRPECKKCIKLKREEYRQGYKIKHNENNRAYYRRRAEDYTINPSIYLYTIARKRAIKYGVEFTISEDDIKVPEYCPITEVKLEVFVNTAKQSYLYAASLDRIDNNKGYIPGNVRVISRKANMMKRELTIHLAERLIKYMKGEI